MLLKYWVTVVNLNNLNNPLKLYSSFGGILLTYVYDQTIDFAIPFVSFIEHIMFINIYSKQWEKFNEIIYLKNIMKT